jgi:hypothetical protein
MNATQEFPNDATSNPSPSGSSSRGSIGRIAFIASFALIALLVVAGIVGFAVTRNESSSETARGANAVAEGNGFDHADVSSTPDSVATVTNDSAQSATDGSNVGNNESATPTSLPQNGSGSQPGIADPGTPPNAEPPLSIPNITLPIVRFPIVNVDLVGPTLVSGISIWCTPNYRWEFQVDDPSGVAAAWATYRVNGVFHSINFQRGVLDNGWWGGTGIANPQGLAYTNFTISARDGLGNISSTNLLGAC